MARVARVAKSWRVRGVSRGQAESRGALSEAPRAGASDLASVMTSDDDGSEPGVYIAIIYFWTLVVPDHPLHGIRYIGQSVRSILKYATPQLLFEKRKTEHWHDANTRPKDLGFRAVLLDVGYAGFVSNIHESMSGPLLQCQQWANERESYWIQHFGGKLRDMWPIEKIAQTLNLTDGGNGDPALWWGAIKARSDLSVTRCLNELRKFKESFGHVNVHRDYVTEQGYRLGSHVHQLRSSKSDVNASAVSELESMGFVWNCVSHHQNEFVKAVRKFKEQTGHCRLPMSHPWYMYCKSVRYQTHVPQAILDELTAIGFAMRTHDARWEQFFAEMKIFCDQFGHSFPPVGYVSPSGYKLQKASHNVRTRKNFIKGHPDANERLFDLESIGFKWKRSRSEAQLARRKREATTSTV